MQGAETILYCALDKNLSKETGQIYRFGKHFKSAMKKMDGQVGKSLWDISLQLVGLNKK